MVKTFRDLARPQPHKCAIRWRNIYVKIISAIKLMLERITKLRFLVVAFVPSVNRPKSIYVFAGSHLLIPKHFLRLYIHNLSAVPLYPKNLELLSRLPPTNRYLKLPPISTRHTYDILLS